MNMQSSSVSNGLSLPQHNIMSSNLRLHRDRNRALGTVCSFAVRLPERDITLVFSDQIGEAAGEEAMVSFVMVLHS